MACMGLPCDEANPLQVVSGGGSVMRQFFYDDNEPIVDRRGRVISLQMAVSAPCRYSRWLRMKAAGEVGTSDDLRRFLHKERSHQQ